MRFSRRGDDTKTTTKTKKQQTTTGRLEMKAVAGAVGTHQWRQTVVAAKERWLGRLQNTRGKSGGRQEGMARRQVD